MLAAWERKDINGLSQLWTLHVRQDVPTGVTVAGAGYGGKQLPSG